MVMTNCGSPPPATASLAAGGVLENCLRQTAVTINGNGDVMGSVVANDLTLVGNAAFHYDESLANSGETNEPIIVPRWRRLRKRSS